MALNSCDKLHSPMKTLDRFLILALMGAASGVLISGTAAAADQKDTPAPQPATTATAPHEFPITTSSAAAARYFEVGMQHFENHRWNFALHNWREAVQLDPQFALAYAWICFTTTDTAEENDSRSKAKAAINAVTPPEQLMVKWIVGVHENRYVEGIAAMNDLLADYPGDKRLNFLAGYWLFRQDQYEPSRKFTLRALAADPTYATAYNQLGYLYSRMGENDKALEAMEKYVKLLPNEPNPHDSYAEMLRLAGHFDEALAHYRMALKIDPTFYISQKELGETYALMGEGEKAREEYAKAIHEAPSSGLKAEYAQKSALTYVRDKKYAEADQAFLEAAKRAHDSDQWVWEARAYRDMAMYQPDPAVANQSLDRADGLLAAHKDAVAKVDFDEEHARILRARIERNLPAGPKAPLNSAAQTALAELEKMAASGSSIAITRTAHGAQGTLLVAEQKFKAAIPYLQEDYINPQSMRLLIVAYRKTHNADADALRDKLLAWRMPSPEEAVVVFDFRSQEGPLAAKK
jgi:tetratricopeptide (TPR) repeat protein